MRVFYSYTTNIGGKKCNQDSLFLMQAETEHFGQVTFAGVCDGMGGLSKGELASAELVAAFRKWFSISLPEMLRTNLKDLHYNFPMSLHNSWQNVIMDVNRRLLDYGDSHGTQLGTTIAGILIFGTQYYIVNVGDSRVYGITENNLQILTHDQTVAMAAVDRGEITLAQMEQYPQRNVLLECVGVNETVDAQYISGSVREKIVFMICSDGLRHLVSEDEIHDVFRPNKWTSEQEVRDHMDGIIQTVLQRGERDNITVISLLVKND